MDSIKVKSHHPLPNDHSQAGLPKKPKLHHHDGKPKKHKSDKHKSSKHDKSSVPVKKELPSPIKRKPMISESESEDDIPLSIQNANVMSQAPPTRSESPLATVKMEGKVELGSQMGKQEPSLAVKNEKKLLCDDDDIPLAQLKSKPSKAKAGVKRKSKADDSDRDDDEDYKVQLKSKPSKAKAGVKRKSRADNSDKDDDEDFKPKKPKPTPPSKTKLTIPKSAPARGRKTKAPPKGAAKAASGASAVSPVKGGRKKKEEEREVWKWWEEKPHPEGVKWLSLEHKGPYFAPAYEPLPKDIKFRYDGKVMSLSTNAEEAAGFFAKMLDHEYTTRDVFCKNFFQDWRKEMTAEEASTISKFSKCDFKEIHAYYKERSEERKAMSKDQKAALKAENEAIVAEYGWCMIDGHKEKIGNFKIEPPGLFRGRGDHPKQGKIKKRIEAEDVIINIGQDAVAPDPPPGHRWGKVQHDSKVTWLASWTENIQASIKYVMLNPTSRLKGEKDWAKYEVARRLKTKVDVIRRNYESDFKSKEMKSRQRAVAMYFIDKLALRAGNEKDSDESADTVGCCSLRVEHLTLHDELDGKDRMVVFDFLGKDSIRYLNSVQVDKAVFKNLGLFMKDKDPGDDLFDRLNTGVLNQHLSSLMDGLTAKVFRTYNASNTLQEQLIELTQARDVLPSKILSYNRANRAVAILCNHQRAPPKMFDKQMSNLQEKIAAKEDSITETKSEIKSLKKEVKATKDSKATKKLEAKKKQLVRLEEQLQKLEVQATDKQENKEIALSTSKLNYLDPRISVAWCKKYAVPLEKVYNKSQRDKFAWAIDMAGSDFEF